MKFMTNTLRNTLVLLFLMIIIVGVSFTTQWRLKNATIKLQSRNAVVAKQVDSLKVKLLALPQGNLINDEIQKRMHADKLLMNYDDPTVTYQYLLKLCNVINSNMIFDFSLANEQSGSPVNSNEYIIVGHSKFSEIAQLINQLESQRAVYTVEKVALMSDNQPKSDSLSFTASVISYYDSTGTSPDMIQLKDLSYLTIFPMMFTTKVYSPIAEPNETRYGLVDIDKVRLIGLTSSRAFVKDANGIVSILAAGDKVKNGWVISIDQVKECVKFKVNNTGLIEEKIMYIRKDAK